MTYARTTTVDAAPAGDVVKQAVLDVDTDLTGIYANLNTHETATTGIHGAGSGTLVSTTGTQTLTAKTISGATITGAVDCSGATLSSPTITGATISNPTITGATINGTLAGNVTGNVTGDVTGNCSGTAATVTGAAQAAITSLGVLTSLTTGALKVTTGAGTGRILLSDADGDLSYLALGTANQKLFTSNGATTAEWAKGYTAGTFTRVSSAASGNVSYTGIGFKPSLVLFSTGYLGWYGSYFGAATAEVTASNVASGVLSTINTHCVTMVEEAGKMQTAVIMSFDSNGFTLGWVKTGNPTEITFTVAYVAIR